MSPSLFIPPAAPTLNQTPVGLSLEPDTLELRLLAQNLNALAEMAVRLPTGGKHFRPTRVAIGGEINQQPQGAQQ